MTYPFGWCTKGGLKEMVCYCVGNILDTHHRTPYCIGYPYGPYTVYDVFPARPLTYPSAN